MEENTETEKREFTTFERSLLDRIAALEGRVAEYDAIIARGYEAMEMAKKNPMIGNLLKSLGV
jgi:predicted LPLAT superfamily acyltransferase